MTVEMKKQLTKLIVNRLTESKELLKAAFFQEHNIKVARHFTLDNLLPKELAERIYADFPNPQKMHLLNIPGKLKLKYSHLKDVSTLLQDINAAIQDPKVVSLIEEITEIKNQVPDTSAHAGGISTLLKGYRLNPHLDNSHNMDKKHYRTVNVLYYVSPDWQIANGGNFELWDQEIKHCIVVPSLFNRLLVMETNQTSWHAVNPVLCNAPRCCVFNYFFSEDSPDGEKYFFNNNSFRSRPEQKFRRAIEGLKRIF